MSLKQFFLALCLGAVLIQVGLQCAKAEPPYQIVLEDEFGNTLPTYAHKHEWFAQGREGQRYNVRVYNHTGRRVEAVVSVDGRDVLSGGAGNFKEQRGYIVPAYGSVLIDGFRTSLSSVAAFRFTSPDDSYSARMGTPENVGVVGAAFFPEHERPVVTRRPPIARPYDYYSGAEPQRRERSDLGSAGPSAAPSAEAKAGSGSSAGKPASAPRAPSREMERGRSADSYASSESYDDSSNIGTQYGEHTRSDVSEVSFARARPSSPDRVLTLRYDNREGLMARGILPRPRTHRYEGRYEGPEPFPVNRFAPPPPPRPYSY
jgi:hypothetical protein